MGSRSSDTTNETKNQYTDNRQVYDAGGGIAGSGNLWDTSSKVVDSGNTTWTSNQSDSRQTSNSGNTSWTQNTADNRSTKDSGNTTWNSDSSNRSTNNTTWNSDSSNRSTNNWTQNVTDGGAIKGMETVSLAQSDLAAKVAKIAADSATSATGAAMDAQGRALSFGGNALDFAKTSSAQAYKSSADALGMVGEKFSDIAKLTGTLLQSAQKQSDSAAGSVAAAYSSAASQANGNKTLTIAALAAVGLVAAMVVLRK